MTAEIGGDGWESNPPGTPQQRPADGFEDRGEHQLSIIPTSRKAYPDRPDRSDQIRDQPPSPPHVLAVRLAQRPDERLLLDLHAVGKPWHGDDDAGQ
jgi:hypothetical protein